MTVSLIWAQTSDGVIGLDGEMPWHLPEDLAHFKQLTLGGTVVMGRRTWESIPERFRPLPGRRNVVVTRQPDWASDGAEVAGSLREALTLPHPDAAIWVIGGGEVYAQALEYADLIEVTEIDLDTPGDTFAPRVPDDWSVSSEPQQGWMTSRTGLPYRFHTITPRSPRAHRPA